MDAIIELTQGTEQLKLIANRIKGLQDDLNKNEAKLETLNSALKLIQLTKSYKINSRKDFILDIINQGLKIIFDENYRIDLESEESKTANKYTINYKLRLYKNDKLVATNQELFETSGGGLITIISFVLKIILGYVNTKNKFYIFDESFSQISEEFRPGVAKLLKLLSTKYGFTFLIISHENLQDEDIDLAYYFTSRKSDDNIPTTVIARTKLKDKYFLDDDYYEVEISNFQSLKSAKVKIKGVTVIYGRSDSGKSAFQRAIRSLITNSFNADLYKRWKTSRTNLTTKVRLSKIQNNETQWVEFEHKSKLIYRSHNGDEFVGKKLANDNIMQILESFGFAQITNDKLSKLTGDLKTQTERIFVTTQFDKFYLTNDRSGVDKILTILFDSHLLNDVISNIKNDINSLNAKNKIIFESIHDDTIKLKQTKLKVFKIISNKIIDEYVSKKYIVTDIVNSMNEINSKLNKIDSLLNLIESNSIVNSIESKNNTVAMIIRSTDTKRSQKIVIDKIIEYINTIEQIITLQTLNKKVNQYSIDSTIIKTKFKIINNLELNDTIKLFNSKLKELKSFESAIIDINSKHSITSNLVELLEVKSEVEQLELINERLNDSSRSIKLNHDIITKLDSITALVESQKVIDQLINKRETVKDFEKSIAKCNEEIDKVPETLGIQICDHCHGLGYIEK